MLEEKEKRKRFWEEKQEGRSTESDAAWWLRISQPPKIGMSLPLIYIVAVRADPYFADFAINNVAVQNCPVRHRKAICCVLYLACLAGLRLHEKSSDLFAALADTGKNDTIMSLQRHHKEMRHAISFLDASTSREKQCEQPLL